MATTTSARFNWSDPFLLDQQLTEDERMIVDTARAYAKDKLAPRALEMFRNEGVDASIFREMGALDMLGIVIPEQYGGSGLGYVAYGVCAREIERVDSGFRSMMSVRANSATAAQQIESVNRETSSSSARIDPLGDDDTPTRLRAARTSPGEVW